MSEKNILEEIAEKTNKEQLHGDLKPEGKTSASSGTAESSGRKSTTAAFLSGSPEKTGHVLHL